ncbi:hypothetical protein M1466_03725 [Candidatus Dependentiae bacterium]|nr:hypothetical protein [Candidatus Dependentiae bacterium]
MLNLQKKLSGTNAQEIDEYDRVYSLLLSRKLRTNTIIILISNRQQSVILASRIATTSALSLRVAYTTTSNNRDSGTIMHFKMNYSFK